MLLLCVYAAFNAAQNKICMRVLLIGGTGLLSTEILKCLLGQGHELSIINRGRSSSPFQDMIKIYKADINKTKNVQNLLKSIEFDVVVDFVSYTVAELKNVLNIFALKCDQFIFISTACVYRRNNKDGIIREDSPLINPNWIYSKNKADCEKFLITRASELGLNYTIVRPYITYGNKRLPFGILPDNGYHWTYISRILNDKPVFLWDDGKAICTLTHVADFAKGVVGLIGNKCAYNEEFNVTGDETYTWEEVLLMIGKQLGKELFIEKIPSVFIVDNLPELKGILIGDRCLDAIFDNSKIKKTIPSLSFGMTLENGIDEVLESYKKNNFYKGIDYVWDAKIDRLICNYQKKNNKSYNCNMRYIDYLNDKSVYNHLIYYMNRHYSNRFVSKISQILK